MITCKEYDYIEIVCTYQYLIKLTMKNGHIVEGVALDTQYNDKREECIKVDAEGIEVIISLDTLATLEVCVENPHLKLVSFS